MKFKNEEYKVMFLVECGLPVPSDLNEWEPNQDMQGLFIKRNRNILPKLKSFRRSQAAKAAWRKNRYSIMTGITDFHKSTAGKRFHRDMGRFLATRDFSDFSILRNRNEGLTLKDICLPLEERGTMLKALSSIKTHLYIENEYFHPLSEQIDLDLFIEEVVDTFDRIEKGIIFTETLNTDDLDLLVFTVYESGIKQGLSERFNIPMDIINDKYNTAKNMVSETLHDTEIGFYLGTLETAKALLK